MKKLQNNFTTPEQSKRLLELGVPADSADLYFPSFEKGDKSQPHLLYDMSYSKRVPIGYEKLYLPCWSVGRLTEITKICITDKDALTEIFELLRDCTFITRNLCLVFEEYSDVLDFSKLEK